MRVRVDPRLCGAHARCVEIRLRSSIFMATSQPARKRWTNPGAPCGCRSGAPVAACLRQAISVITEERPA